MADDRSIVTVLETKIEITNVLDVIQTEPEQDLQGMWVREIRIYGTPEEGVSGLPQVLAVRLRSPVKDNLKITSNTTIDI
jgi:hypothetical protein